MSSLGLGFGLTSIPVLRNQVPLAVKRYLDALAAAQAVASSMWLFPPASVAPPETSGPFVNSDQSGGNPALGSGVIGWLKDFSGSNNATQSVSANRAVYAAAPDAVAAAAGYGCGLFDGANDSVSTAAAALNINGNWWALISYHQATLGGFQTVFCPVYTLSAERLLLYVSPAGAPVIKIRPASGSGVDFETQIMVAPTTANDRVTVLIQRNGSTVTSYRDTNAAWGSWTPTLGSYGTAGTTILGTGEGPFAGRITMAACGNGVLTADQRKALLDLAVYVG